MGEKVDSPIQAQIIDFDIVIEHGLNQSPNHEDSSPNDAAYDYSTSVTLICEILTPKEHQGYTLELELCATDIGPYTRKYTPTLDEWQNLKRTSDDDYYILPPSIGYIGRSRNKRMEGFLQVAPRVVSDLLTTFQLNKKLYINIKARKENGSRSVDRISINHKEIVDN